MLGEIGDYFRAVGAGMAGNTSPLASGLRGFSAASSARGLARGLANYNLATNDADRNLALAEMARYNPEAAQSFMIKSQLAGGQGRLSDLQWQFAQLNDPDVPEEEKALIRANLQRTAQIPEYMQDVSGARRRGTLLEDISLGGKVIEAATPAEVERQRQIRQTQKDVELAMNPEIEAETIAAKKQAEQKIESEKKQVESQIRQNQIDDLMVDVTTNKDLLRPYSGASATVGAWTGGVVGMSEADRIKRGELLRGVADIKNNLIARAKAQGQSGINTATEIEQATKGIDSGDYATLIGGLNALKKYEKEISRLEQQKSKTSNVEAPAKSQVGDKDTFFKEFGL